MRLWYDIESYSPVSLTARGLYPYAEEAEVILTSHAIDDGPVTVWDRASGELPPLDLVEALRDPTVEVCAHNAAFDRVVSRGLFAELGVDVALERWRCTMVRAYSVGLPGALADICAVLGLPQDQQKADGMALIRLFCIPQRDGSRVQPWQQPRFWRQFKDYAGQDIVSMRAATKRMPLGCWAKPEVAVYHLDQRVNDRGIYTDQKLAEGAILETTRYTAENKRAVTEATDGAVTAVTQRDKFLKYLVEQHGIELPDFRKATLEARVDDPDLPEGVQELLRLRLAGSMSSVAKYRKVISGCSSDGRMRGTTQYMGAGRTGRWVARRLQWHNLPRPTMKKADIARGVELLREGNAWMDYDVMELAKNALRGLAIAAPGRKLVVSDFKNVEGRVAAWIAGEDWKLQAFRMFDLGKGPDTYVLAYSRSFNVPIEKVLENDKTGDGHMRQSGKVQELALQFQGALGAIQSMAANYGLEITDQRALELVRAWRKANPRIVQAWYDLDEAVRLSRNGRKYEVGPLEVEWKDPWLSIRLPSGRKLYYPKPAVGADDKISFGSVNRYTKRWDRTSIYGGKFYQNCVQAIARDLLANGLELAEREGYLPILHVHDEPITETPDTSEYSAKGLSRIITQLPDWATGLPLAAGGFEAPRYRKD